MTYAYSPKLALLQYRKYSYTWWPFCDHHFVQNTTLSSITILYLRSESLRTIVLKEFMLVACATDDNVLYVTPLVSGVHFPSCV